MSRSSKKLIVAIYNDEKKAKDEFKLLLKEQSNSEVDIDAYAVIIKHKDGTTSVSDTEGRDALWGGILGLLIGVVAGPVGAFYAAAASILTAIAGTVLATTGIGAIAGWLTSDALKIPNDLVKDIKSNLKEGTSAILLIVEEEWLDTVEKEVLKSTSNVHEYIFDENTVERVEKDFEEIHQQLKNIEK